MRYNWSNPIIYLIHNFRDADSDVGADSIDIVFSSLP